MIINIKEAQANLYQLVSDVNECFNPINIINSKGKNAILLSERDWRTIEETIYLNSIPDFINSIEEARKENKKHNTTYVKGEKW